MNMRENESRKTSLKLSGKEIEVAVKMLHKLESTIDIIYYLMENENVQSFVLLLITAKDVDMKTLLDKEKRDTDILFDIDEEESIYVMLCQDTSVDGGYRFAERIIRNIVKDKGSEIYCSELEIKATHYTPKQIVLKLIEIFIKSKQSKKSGEIVFRSLN